MHEDDEIRRPRLIFSQRYRICVWLTFLITLAKYLNNNKRLPSQSAVDSQNSKLMAVGDILCQRSHDEDVEPD
jgi:hypothetical protein